MFLIKIGNNYHKEKSKALSLNDEIIITAKNFEYKELNLLSASGN